MNRNAIPLLFSALLCTLPVAAQEAAPSSPVPEGIDLFAGISYEGWGRLDGGLDSDDSSFLGEAEVGASSISIPSRASQAGRGLFP